MDISTNCGALRVIAVGSGFVVVLAAAVAAVISAIVVVVIAASRNMEAVFILLKFWLIK
jgi:hypothetical protein